jgi:hypothetical protein
MRILWKPYWVHLVGLLLMLGCPTTVVQQTYGWTSPAFPSSSSSHPLHSRIQRRCPRTRATRVADSSMFEYDYVPSNSDSDDDDEKKGKGGRSGEASSSYSYQTNPALLLTSSYDLGTPAGLRGEAIRSALRSGRCVGWNLASTPLQQGVVQVTGRGTRSFLSSKLTQSFPLKNQNNNNSSSTIRTGSFHEACLLTAKGRVVDRLEVGIADNDDNDNTAAYMLTSPGHTSQTLFQRLDPFVFPLHRAKQNFENGDGAFHASPRKKGRCGRKKLYDPNIWQKQLKLCHSTRERLYGKFPGHSVSRFGWSNSRCMARIPSSWLIQTLSNPISQKPTNTLMSALPWIEW